MSNPSSRNKNPAAKIAITGMLAAVAFAFQYLEVSIPIVPSFLKLDFSDIPELIGAFVIGPVYGVIICLLKNLLHLPFGSSAGIGELANFLIGAVFAFTAGIIYQHKKTKKVALIACITGALAMSVASIIINLLIVYPAYAQIWFGGDMDKIVGMYKALLPASDTLMKSLLIFNLPFTFGKGIIDAVVTMVIYKPLSKNIFAKINSSSPQKKSDTNSASEN